MSGKTTVDKQQGLVIHEVEGPLTLEVAMAAFEAALEHPDFKKNMPSILDLRRADLTAGGNFPDMKAFAKHVQESSGARGAGYKVAMVVGREVDFGISRMMASIAADVSQQFLVCYSMDQARTWITGEEASSSNADSL